MEKLSQESVDLVAQNVRKLQELFPECVTEARDDDGRLKQVVDYERLKQALTGEVSYDPEAYQFTWVGKKDAYADAFRSTRKILRPCPAESLDWNNTKNLYLEGDNLEVLKLLQESYLMRVKLIYIDPPYNTGSDAFVYPDGYTMDEQEYEEFVGRFDKMGNILFKENNASNPRFHSDWCSMIYARLLIARNLLSDDGAIFISIDDNEHDNLKKICDEVFGPYNFITNVVWEKKYSPANDAKWFSDNHDFIVVYAKNKELWRPKLLPRSDEMNSRYTNKDADPRGVWKPTDMTAKTYSPSYDYPITTPGNRIVYPSHGTCWRVSKERFDELVQDNRIWFGESGNNVPAIKKFLTEVKDGTVPTTIWKYEDVGHNQEGRQELKKLFDDKGYFDGPKPVRLLRRILQVANLPDDAIVLDFFSGSATTAHAVMELNAEDGGNRQFIMVQLPELCDKKSFAFKAGYKTICEIGKERIRRAGAKIKSEHALDRPDLDVGFRVFKIDESNMTDAYYYPSEYTKNLLDPAILSVKPDRTELDLLFGCVLDCGLPLSLPYKLERIGEATVHNYAEGALFACFDARVSIDSVIAMALRSPLRVVFRESSFERSDEKINVAELFKQYSKYPTRIKTL